MRDSMARLRVVARQGRIVNELDGGPMTEPNASSHAAESEPTADPLAHRLATDLLALAHRSAVQAIFSVAAGNQRRLDSAEVEACRHRAAGEHAAALTLEAAVEENARSMEDVQRRAEALVRVVQAQLRSLGLGETAELSIFDLPPNPSAPSLADVAGNLPSPPTPATVTAPPASPDPPSPAAQHSAAPPPAAPPAGPVVPLTVPPEDLPVGTYDLVVGPFARFSALATFTETLKHTPGMQAVATRQVHRGTVHFRLLYDGPVSLAAMLERVPGFRLEVLSDRASRLDVQVLPEDGDEVERAAGAERGARR